jgi:hypothetical protein
MTQKIALYVVIGLLLTTLSCRNGNQDNNVKSNTKTTLAAPNFNADSAFAFVKIQTDFGPRVPNSEAHRKCGNYLFKQLKRFCDTVFTQPFNVKTYDGVLQQACNFIGSFNPNQKERIILAAHWDSRPLADQDSDPNRRQVPIDGANDGASGVGVLLEVARQLHLLKPATGIDIVFFDVEDYGTPASENIPGDWWCLGAQHWAKNFHKAGYTAQFGILLDMVGSPNARFYQEGVSTFYAQDIVSKVWGRAYELGFGHYFINTPANPVTDDHYYVNTLAKIKMIDIIHQDQTTGTGFDHVWHTHNDNIANIDKNTLSVVGKVVLSIIER